MRLLPKLFRRRPSSLPSKWHDVQVPFIFCLPPREKGGRWSEPRLHSQFPERLQRADTWSRLSDLSYRVAIGAGLDTFAWTQFWDKLTWMIEALEATHYIHPLLITGRPDIAAHYLKRADPYLLARTTLIMRKHAHDLKAFHVEQLLASPTRYNAVMLVNCWHPIEIPQNLSQTHWILSRPAPKHFARKEFAHGPPWRCQWELLRFAHTHRIPFFQMATHRPIHVAVRQYHTGANLGNLLEGRKAYRYFSPMRRNPQDELLEYDLPTVALPHMPTTNWGLDYYKKPRNVAPSSERSLCHSSR